MTVVSYDNGAEKFLSPRNLHSSWKRNSNTICKIISDYGKCYEGNKSHVMTWLVGCGFPELVKEGFKKPCERL